MKKTKSKSAVITQRPSVPLSDTEVIRSIYVGTVAREYLKNAACSGSEKLFNELLKTAYRWNEAVEAARNAQPALAKKLAAGRSVWPGNYAGHPAAVDSLVAALRELGLGSVLPVQAASSVPWRGRKRLDSPAQSISVNLWDWLVRTRKAGIELAITPWEQTACGLTPLVDEVTRREWFECAWGHFEAAYDGDVLRCDEAAAIAGTKRKGRNKPAGYVKDQVFKASQWLRK